MANLNEMSNEQREEYYQQVCRAVGLDPALRLLDYIWIEQENGLKNLVLYCRRGGAEILRAKQAIEVIDLIQHDGSGYVSFKAIGKNKEGRQEIANGTHSTEGLRGERLASAIMTASTRSLRRLTMQFTGCGILDESEVGSPEARITASSQATLAGGAAVIPPMQPPQAPISQAPGKDITPTTEIQSQFETRQDALRVDAQKQLADIPASKNVSSVSQNPPNQGVSSKTIADIKADKCQVLSQENSTEPKKRGRPRKQRNTVVLESPGQQIEMPAGYIDAAGQITSISVPLATANEPEQGVSGNGQTDIPALAETPDLLSVVAGNSAGVAMAFAPAPQPAVSVLPKEKQDEYRSRLSKYYNDILPRGGMQSSEGIGGPTMKVRKFAAIHTGVTDTKLMTEDHWNDLFEFLDAHASDPKFLVDYINRALGVA